MRTAWAGLLLTLAVSPAAAETVKSLDEVPGQLRTPEAKDTFAQQMAGKPTPDGLGLQLPPGLDATAITALLLAPGDKATVNAVGAKPLPGQADRYVAIVCTGGDLPTRPEDPKCTRDPRDDSKKHMKVHVGVIEMPAGGTPRLGAKPVVVDDDGTVDWDASGLPSTPDTDRAPDGFDRFDLAAYQIAPNQRAFGLRGSWTDSYSGGMGTYGALYLFAVVDGALKQVLAAPMSAYKDIAGDWNKNGTRAHDVVDNANILIVSTHSTNGHFDLTLKPRVGKGRQTLQWSAVDNRYTPVKK